MTDYHLILGNRNYSSWSLRAWLCLKLAGQPFEETWINLGEEGFREKLKAISPTGLVPVLKHGDLVLPESLAICEYIAERHPEADLWPADPVQRARARSVSAEMHSGFRALRMEMPMNLTHRTDTVTPSDACGADIDAVHKIWRHCREHYGAGGDFLFGHVTIADAMFAPVVSRFRTYGVDGDTVTRPLYDGRLEPTRHAGSLARC